MGVLDAVMQFKKQEREAELADINAIGSSVNNFIALRQQGQDRAIQAEDRELNRRLIESRIEKNKPSILDQLVNRAKSAEAIGFLADQGDPDAIEVFNALTGKKSVLQTVNENLSPVAQIAPELANKIEADREGSLIRSRRVKEQAAQRDKQEIPEFEKTVTGKLTTKGEIEKKAFEERQSASIQVGKEVAAKVAKEQVSSSQDLLNVDLKIDSSFDSFLDVAQRTRDITGVGPGVIGGTISKVLGATRANEFVKGFEGGLIEVAAAVGRVAIPGARAVRLVDLFKKTGISINDTLASAITTSADSFRNGLATDMSRNPKEYLTSEQLDLPKAEQSAILKDQLRDFEALYRQTMFVRAFKKNPDLFSETERQNFVKETIDTPVKINNIEEADSLNLPIGTRIQIGNEIFEEGG